MAYLKTTDSNVGIKAGTVPSGVDVTFPGVPQRRLYNFGERVAELAPEESPFFTYLSKVAKSPTDDSVFKVLENRSKIDWTNRNGTLGAVTTDLTQDAEIDDIVVASSSGYGGNDILAGSVLMVDRLEATTLRPIPVLMRVVSNGASGSGYLKVEVLENSGDAGTDIAADAKFQIVGSSFEEGGTAPGFWSGGIDDRFGYTQIFKTACYMTGTAMATKYRGYASEWDRVWNLKLREHKVDIERAMLFGQKARVTGSDSNAYQVSDGIIGFILRNAGTEGSSLQSDDDATDWAYEADSPYVRQITYAAMTYDRFLGDLEVMFDPARGGGYGKLCMAGLPTITWFNKLGSSGFLDNSAPSNSLSIDVEPRSGAFGHKITQVDTVHGQLNIVKDPLLRAQSAGYMPCVDIDHVAYRPLVGNGQNRDTHIMTNVQSPDEDSRKDQIITEAGLEVTLPETHALYCFS
jgi:hypothetical protein|tara:strand:- start:457 stop:1842 length:1386 start_codon:yes stop_codon:yes gene_type:complete